MREDIDLCIRTVDKLLRQALRTPSFDDRSRLLREALLWHERGLALARAVDLDPAEEPMGGLALIDQAPGAYAGADTRAS